jgi:hypothetical protein
MTDDNKSFAFPCTGEGYGSSHYTQKGMTLRDYFAGQAMAVVRNSNSPAEHAFFSYELADAMLSARASA